MRDTTVNTIQYIAPDNIVYYFDKGDRWLLSDSGSGMPPIDYITAQGPYQHGESVLTYRLKPRTIQVVHRVNSCSRNSFWTNRATLVNYLRPNRQGYGLIAPGTLRYILADGSQRDLKVFIDEGPVFAARSLDKWDEFGIQETIRFIAHDPIFYDPTLHTSTFTLTASNHLIFPFSFQGSDLVFATNVINNNISITYAGTWEAFPTITITGPIDGPIITNTTTGEKIQLNYVVAAGEVVTINLAFNNKTVLSSLTGQDLIGLISSDSNLATFSIVPEPTATGGVNTINVIGGGATVGQTAVVVSYYTRYIGI